MAKNVKSEDMTTRIAHRILEKVRVIKDSLPVIGRKKRTKKTTAKRATAKKTSQKKSSARKTASSKRTASKKAVLKKSGPAKKK